jgi:hypothetical protein
MSGFENGYSSPGSVEKIGKASTTMMHARGSKKVRRMAGHFTGGRVTWQTQRDVADPNSEAQTGDDDVQHYPGEEDDRETDLGYFTAKHMQSYDDINPQTFLDGLDSGDDGECDEGGAHLACCAQHLANAKEAHTGGDVEGCHKALNGAMYHFSQFHKSLKEAINQ